MVLEVAVAEQLELQHPLELLGLGEQGLFPLFLVHPLLALEAEGVG
tara:strand:- start:143 stop:280 length:138 start_codon:yes stop_codon:yes gene_type:complete